MELEFFQNQKPENAGVEKQKEGAQNTTVCLGAGVLHGKSSDDRH